MGRGLGICVDLALQPCSGSRPPAGLRKRRPWNRHPSLLRIGLQRVHLRTALSAKEHPESPH
jgi:hypothetical protein